MKTAEQLVAEVLAERLNQTPWIKYEDEPIDPADITDVSERSGEGDIQIGDMTWDYDPDSVTFKHKGVEREVSAEYVNWRLMDVLRDVLERVDRTE